MNGSLFSSFKISAKLEKKNQLCKLTNALQSHESRFLIKIAFCILFIPKLSDLSKRKSALLIRQLADDLEIIAIHLLGALICELLTISLSIERLIHMILITFRV